MLNRFIIDMKKSFIFISAVIISLLSFSCSNSRDVAEDSSDLYTIKSLVSDIENETVWSLELEGDRLTRPVKEEVSYIPEGHTLTTENVKLSASFKPPVYPSFRDFGSLDISSLEYKYLESAGTFSSYLAEWNQEKIYACFPSNYRFNYIFFADELKKGWKDNFKTAFPDSDVFNRWILGQPALLDNLIQFPVRFYCNSGYVDVTLYMSPDKDKTLYNIKIERWEKHE